MVISDNFPRNKLCVNLIIPYNSRKYRPKINILLKPFSLNPPAQYFYITHNIAMMIANLVEIICTTDYYNS